MPPSSHAHFTAGCVRVSSTVIWIDKPSGSGYSYSDAGDIGPFDEVGVADNVYQFLQGFLSQYSQFTTVPFYLMGESYAGHYLPSVATRILQGNEAGGEPLMINLDAVGIGNGLVNPAAQYPEYLPFITVQGVLPNSSLSIMAAGLPGCEAAIASCGWNSTTGLLGCLTAMETCNLYELMPFQLSGLNVYDVREKCAVPPLCYNFTNVDLFLAQPDVIAALGTTGITWQSCNRIVELELVFAGDWMRDLSLEIPGILASKVRVVVYSGEYDFVSVTSGMHALRAPRRALRLFLAECRYTLVVCVSRLSQVQLVRRPGLDQWSAVVGPGAVRQRAEHHVDFDGRSDRWIRENLRRIHVPES